MHSYPHANRKNDGELHKMVKSANLLDKYGVVKLFLIAVECIVV